jgi:3-dehydroquinate synthase
VSEREVLVRSSRPYTVRIGPGALTGLPEALGGRRAFVLTDANVEPLHAGRLGALTAAPRRAVAPGEEAKRMAVLEEVLEALAEAGLGRGGVLVALGGGTVGDLGGLAAALFVRGIDWVACPTTLLAQVDASVGGKTAVNLRAGKNLAGAFHPPAAVLADTEVLATLPEDELRSGLGELAKTALIAGEELLALVEEAASELVAREPETLARAVALAVAAKARIVESDEREAGPREVLNLGHTFGHALEHAAGYAFPHGVMVAYGILLALQVSARLGLLADARLPERVAVLHARLGLPSHPVELRALLTAVPVQKVMEALRLDKKRRGGGARLVLPIRAGEVRAGVEVEDSFLLELLEQARG